ncbi:hypothetical protein E0E54_20760 [Azotobacter chroococcum]|uniref:hypothetical protein n=1 Tax=Azotobacter chroococcum TaxID=353 RepID=UPI00103C105A|nr:hypothetical protein [Azotobacter chroococcum]TBW31900.1 hypothetical protein E0E54_20760 [Azotobacter chroococcum]
MSADSLNIHIDLVALQATFFRRLQHQLDVTKVLQVGCEQVTPEQIAAQQEFGRFVPANGAQLKHEDAKAEAQSWLLRGFLRDAIEGTGLFLDECLQVCEVLPLAAKGTAKEAELHRIFQELPRTNHKLHFPQKLEKLERRFGVATRFNANVLSLNKARTCVVHRLGVVSELDADESGALRVTFQHAKFVARGQETGQLLVIDQPGVVTTEDSMLELHFVDSERCFKLGERVQLQAHELYDTIITLWRFGLATAQAVKTYAKSLGIQFPAPSEA